MSSAVCSREKCGRSARRRGLCQAHYRLDLSRSPHRGTTDAGRVAAHIEQLSAAGIGAERVAELAGVSGLTVYRASRQEKVHRVTAAAILAIPVNPLALASDGALIDATGSTRRLQALVRGGHTVKEIAGRLGYSGGRLFAVMNGSHPRLSAGLARRIAAVYDELHLTPGDDRRAVTRAVKRGWAPAMAWDDGNIDDPLAHPDIGAPPRLQDQVDDARSLGRTDDQIASSLGMSRRTMRRRLRQPSG